MIDELNAEWFDNAFEGMSVTLMATARLNQELELLREALPQCRSEDGGSGPKYRHEALQIAVRVQSLLPPIAPSRVDELRPFLAPLTCSESRQVAMLSFQAQSLLHGRLVRKTSLWLVPAVWSLRMEMLLAGQTFPTRVRSFSTQWPYSPDWEG